MGRTLSRRGFTDKLYGLNFITTWAFVVVCILITITGGTLNIADYSIVVYGIPAAFTQLGLHTGFVVHKAKVENLAKHKCLEQANINVE